MFHQVLSLPPVLNIPGCWIGFCICLCSWCTRASDVPGFWIYQSYGHARVTQRSEYAWAISEYAWLCLDMSKYAEICVNVAISAWIAFVLHFPISAFSFAKHVVTYLNVYKRQEVIVWRNMRLFSWRDKIFYCNSTYFICSLF